MRALVHRAWQALLVISILMLVISVSGTAQAAAQCDAPSPTGTPQQLFEHSYDSGASWSMCVYSDEQAGLSVAQVHYTAPGHQMRKVLESASLAQLLFKYDEDTTAQHWLGSHGLGGLNHLEVTQERCVTGDVLGMAAIGDVENAQAAQQAGDQISEQGNASMCVKHRHLNMLTSVRRSESKQRNVFSLHAWSAVDAFSVEQVWEFSEDGQIVPMVRLGGVLNRFSTNALYSTDIGQEHRASRGTLVSTWKLDFNINDTPNNDIVEAVEFVPHQSNVLRRLINVTGLPTESLHQVNRDRFKGWLIRDRDVSAGVNQDTRIGYYLDPQVSGFSYESRTDNWSVFDMAVTLQNDCEQLASQNEQHNTGCGDSLDDYVSGESLDNGDPVVWFSVARQFLPKREDFPALLVRESKFTLMPFDWTATTPFTPIVE